MKPCFILFFALSIAFAQVDSVKDNTLQLADSAKLKEKLNQLEPTIRLPLDSGGIKEKYDNVELPSPIPVELDSNGIATMNDSFKNWPLDEQGNPIMEGEVFIKALIDFDGSVVRVVILKSSGSPGMDSAAIDAVGKWKFNPAKQNGKPVRVWIGAPIRSKLE